MIDWNIQARARGCQECGKHFADREAYHTVLFDEKLGYRRLDLCLDCWKPHARLDATTRPGFVSHWRGVFEVAPDQPDPIRRETAETLLRRLLEEHDPRYEAACFILAVMLERKRVLRVKAQDRREGRRFFVYEHPKSGDLFAIGDPELQLNQLEDVQRSVAHLLEHGLTPPAPLATPSGSPAPALAAGSGRLAGEPPPVASPVAEPT